MQCPLPLAAIAIRRDLIAQAPAFDAALRASVDYAFAHPEASRDYVKRHAQEMDPTVAQRHIDLYVNHYTQVLDEAAVARFFEIAEEQGLCTSSRAPIFA
jgi:1,4-dihydroxy-6-naphthoate synthase